MLIEVLIHLNECCTRPISFLVCKAISRKCLNTILCEKQGISISCPPRGKVIARFASLFNL